MTSPRDPIDLAKRALRKQCSAMRDAICEADRIGASVRVSGIGLAFGSIPAGASVSGFSAMGSEIDPLGLLEWATRTGYRTCLPVVQPLGHPLQFRAWAPGEPLVARTWGIREPADTAPLVEPDALLVPLLAFDRRGVRLGYGGGYYDRTLERLRRLKPVIAIGLAYAAQELAEVPSGPHDQRLDWVLTENGPIRIEPRP